MQAHVSRVARLIISTTVCRVRRSGCESRGDQNGANDTADAAACNSCGGQGKRFEMKSEREVLEVHAQKTSHRHTIGRVQDMADEHARQRHHLMDKRRHVWCTRFHLGRLARKSDQDEEGYWLKQINTSTSRRVQQHDDASTTHGRSWRSVTMSLLTS